MTEKKLLGVSKKNIYKLKDQNKSEIMMMPLMFQRNAVFFSFEEKLFFPVLN